MLLLRLKSEVVRVGGLGGWDEEDGRGGVACGADGEDVPVFVRTLTVLLVLLDGEAAAATDATD